MNTKCWKCGGIGHDGEQCPSKGKGKQNLDWRAVQRYVDLGEWVYDPEARHYEPWLEVADFNRAAEKHDAVKRNTDLLKERLEFYRGVF